MMAEFNGFINSVCLYGTKGGKYFLCTIPFVNIKMLNIIKTAFDLTKEDAKIVKKFEATYLKGTATQAIISIVLIAAGILFQPVTYAGIALHFGIQTGAFLYSSGSVASLAYLLVTKSMDQDSEDEVLP